MLSPFVFFKKFSQRRPCRLPRSAPLNSRRQFYWIATVYSTAPRESDRGATALLSALEPAERASACIYGRARKRIRELLSVRLMDPAIPTREHTSLGAVLERGPSAGSIICQDDGHARALESGAPKCRVRYKEMGNGGSL